MTTNTTALAELRVLEGCILADLTGVQDRIDKMSQLGRWYPQMTWDHTMRQLEILEEAARNISLEILRMERAARQEAT